MNTRTKIIALCILTVLTAVACRDTNSKKSEKEIQELSARAETPDSMEPAEKISFDFDKYTVDQLPGEWSEFYAGSGGTKWQVKDDEGNNVMAQLYGGNPNDHFNIVVYDNLTAEDMVLTARLKGVTGDHDQGGGFVWRFTDRKNYYVVRANPLEDNVVLYKVENGKRTDLPLIGKGRTYGIDVPPMGNNWHTLKLTVKGDLFTVYMDDKELFKVQDTAFGNSGKVGFWTKADAVTYFDDLEIEKFK